MARDDGAHGVDRILAGAADVPDLGAVGREPPPELRAAALVEAEVRAGVRCGGCRERFEHGYEFVFVEVAVDAALTQGVMRAPRVFACGACPFQAEVAATGPVAMREVRQMILDTPERKAALGFQEAVD